MLVEKIGKLMSFELIIIQKRKAFFVLQKNKYIFFVSFFQYLNEMIEIWTVRFVTQASWTWMYSQLSSFFLLNMEQKVFFIFDRVSKVT